MIKKNKKVKKNNKISKREQSHLDKINELDNILTLYIKDNLNVYNFIRQYIRHDINIDKINNIKPNYNFIQLCIDQVIGNPDNIDGKWCYKTKESKELKYSNKTLKEKYNINVNLLLEDPNMHMTFMHEVGEFIINEMINEFKKIIINDIFHNNKDITLGDLYPNIFNINKQGNNEYYSSIDNFISDKFQYLLNKEFI